MNKSTTHRLLATLESKHFILRDKTTGMYQLGFLFIELASITIRDRDVQRWARPYLEELSSQSSETVDLAILDDCDVIYLQVVESTQRVKIAAAVGERLPATSTASGKAFLAYLPEEKVKRILDQGISRLPENTLVTREKLLEDLHTTRMRGFAISEEEFEKDINAVAAPILDSQGTPLAVIAIVGPSYRMSHERMLALGKMICVTAESIGREVGMAALAVILSKSSISNPMEFTG